MRVRVRAHMYMLQEGEEGEEKGAGGDHQDWGLFVMDGTTHLSTVHMNRVPMGGNVYVSALRSGRRTGGRGSTDPCSHPAGRDFIVSWICRGGYGYVARLTDAPKASADARPRPSAIPPEAMYGILSSCAARAS